LELSGGKGANQAVPQRGSSRKFTFVERVRRNWRGALSFTRSFANVAFSVMADACLDSDLAESASTLQDFDSGQCLRRVS
jgi:hypothetical protein